jgi:hypothetical protein
MTVKKDKKIIGRAETISLPLLGYEKVHARIDTGAKTTSIWASRAQLKDGKLEVVFFGPPSLHFTGEVHTFDHFEEVVVASSNGQVQYRFKIRVLIKLRGKKIHAWVTLADRSTQVYPVLIGRNVLAGKFIVDVQRGRGVLKEAEEQRTHELDDQVKKVREA